MLLDKVAEGEWRAAGTLGTGASPTDPPCPSHPPADMGTLEITRGRQALELRSNLSERRALTDPIRAPGRDETSARNLQWAKAHGEHRGHRTQRWHLRGRGGDGPEMWGEVAGSKFSTQRVSLAQHHQPWASHWGSPLWW